MTVVLKRYRDDDGNHATITQDKGSIRYELAITRPIDGGPFAMTMYHNDYTSIRSARSAMKRISDNWKEEEV